MTEGNVLYFSRLPTHGRATDRTKPGLLADQNPMCYKSLDALHTNKAKQ